MKADREVGIRQALIKKLATEPGIEMIKSSVDLMVDEESDEDTIAIFTDIITPFFRTTSHQDVLSSLILETPLNTIHNFLFGPNGRRLVSLFGSSANALANLLVEATPQSEEQLRVGLTSSLAVFSQVVELCQTAQILTALEPVLETFQSCFADDHTLPAARKSLKKIQRRYNLGKSMPDDASYQTDRELAKQPRFSLEVDSPGELSVHGRRHDNDHEDIRLIRILPTSEEIQCQRQDYLPTIDTSKNFLPGLRGLLDRQFRLLREDSIGGLRDAIQSEIDSLDGRNTSNSKDRAMRNIVHRNVKILRLEIDRRKGLQVIVGFTQPEALRSKTMMQRQEWWTDSKQMQFDALVCLVTSSGRTIFFSVCDPDPTPPTKDKVVGNDDDKTDSSPAQRAYIRRRAEMPSLYANSEFAALALTLVEFKTDDVTWLTSQSGKSSQSRNSLVEFPGILLPSFKPTLEGLQAMKSRLDLPFQDLIAPEQAQPRTINLTPPVYSQQPGFAYDLSPLTGGENLNFAPGQAFDFEKLDKTSVLDQAQQASVLHALSSNLALIHGPPGAGKSFTGVAIIKTLLKNRDAAGLGPIICVCYTNHALDQLLESLVRDDITQVIRIGSRSKSELLQKLNLQHVAQEIETTKTERSQKWECNRSLDANMLELDELLLRLNNPASVKDIREHLERHYPSHFRELFAAGEDEDGFQDVFSRKHNRIHRWLNGPSTHRTLSVVEKYGAGPEGVFDRKETRVTETKRRIHDLTRSPLGGMSRAERKLLYEHWVRELTAESNDQLLYALDQYNENQIELKICKQEVNLRCLLQAHVIGVTTSGLARNLELLRRLRTKVVICEEAGEVLEAHLLTALLPSVEHAVLIGDHEQLRPQITNHELGQEHPRGERFALDVSLFERLVKPRVGEIKVPFASLRTQRRMHPSIAQLVRSTLYPALVDHASVSAYPDIEGMRKRLFWLDHDQKEDSPSHYDSIKSFSKSNGFEVEMVAATVSHLVRQGTHDTRDIVILTPYLGQLRKIKQRLRSSFEIIVSERDLAELDAQGIRDTDEMVPSGSAGPRKITLFKALRVATVDNFQGEEAKIVVVSLVRSNDERRVGFLKTSNRINVLLSRARQGMYIIGNSHTASSVQMWADVLCILEANGNIGRKLALCCPRHMDTPIEVQTPDDFAMFSPEGGCNKKCISRLSCGHACINQCHSEILQ